MSDCSKLQELINLYCDNEITEDEKKLVEEHIAKCTSCKQKLSLLLKAKEVLKNTPAVPVPENLFNDFMKYKEIEEKQEKKIIPFYRNYRMYASLAAIFIFAFVLKSGLLEQDKYIPTPVTQGTYQQQTLTAPVKSNEENVPAKANLEQDALKSENTKVIPQEKTKMQEADGQIAEQAPVQNLTEPIDASQQPVTNDVPEPAAFNEADTQPAAQGGGGGGSSAYSRAIPQQEDIDEEKINEDSVPETEAKIYVLPQYLERTTELLSDNFYLLYQAEQKLTENDIPFESNFLLLDESMQYKITVIVINE